jgi:hypothetical protein
MKNCARTDTQRGCKTILTEPRPEQAPAEITDQNPMSHTFDLSCVADLKGKKGDRFEWHLLNPQPLDVM